MGTWVWGESRSSPIANVNRGRLATFSRPQDLLRRTELLTQSHGHAYIPQVSQRRSPYHHLDSGEYGGRGGSRGFERRRFGLDGQREAFLLSFGVVGFFFILISLFFQVDVLALVLVLVSSTMSGVCICISVRRTEFSVRLPEIQTEHCFKLKGACPRTDWINLDLDIIVAGMAVLTGWTRRGRSVLAPTVYKLFIYSVLFFLVLLLT